MKMTCYLPIERKKRSLLLWPHDKSCMISNTWKWHVIFPLKEKKDHCCYGYMINHALFTAEKSIEVILKDKTKEINVWCVISWLNLQTNLLVKLDQNNSKSIKILVQELVDLYQRFWSHSKKLHSCIIVMYYQV